MTWPAQVWDDMPVRYAPQFQPGDCVLAFDDFVVTAQPSTRRAGITVVQFAETDGLFYIPDDEPHHVTRAGDDEHQDQPDELGGTVANATGTDRWLCRPAALARVRAVVLLTATSPSRTRGETASQAARGSADPLISDGKESARESSAPHTAFALSAGTQGQCQALALIT